jgi:aryl sulfotransferase
MEGPAVWPSKTRDLRNHHLDSRIWNRFKYRQGDVIIASYPKSGTTWTQQIVGQLIFSGAEGPINRISPWMDIRLNPHRRLAEVEAQTHRRILKSHLPLDALVFSPLAKYIYVARDGRDVLWSVHHNHINAAESHFRLLNDPPGRIGPPMEPADPDIQAYFRRWLSEDGYPYWPYWEHIRSWWQARELPNVRLLHFSDLKRDLEGEMRQIAKFLGCDISPGRWPKIVERCTFEYMKEHAEDVAPIGAGMMRGGVREFMHKGTNGRWSDVLTDKDVADYERTAREQLGPECAAWLASGSGASCDGASAS